jgi:hypothetical protein
MVNPFTREIITAGRAKFFVWLAAAFSAGYGLFTLVFVLNGSPGVTKWNLIDVVICFAVAVGILRRSPAACWVGLIYSGLNVAVKVIRYPGTDPLGKVGETITYAMALVCIGLYPREPRASTQATEAGARIGSESDGAV